MAKTQLNPVLQHVRRLALQHHTDVQLLEQFTETRDEGAFAAIVRRYGGLVWSVCRRVLQSNEDAEDALQATFLVLARKAGSLRRAEALGTWLYRVAYHLATKAKRDRARRSNREKRVPVMPPTNPDSELAVRELQSLLDEELERLPEKHRAAFVLCCLQGLTVAEAAVRLGCPDGTVAGRLARARSELRRRLSARGVSLSAALMTVALAANARGAGVLSALVARLARDAVLYRAGQTATLSASVLSLVQGVSTTMIATKTKTATMLFLVAGLFGMSAGWLGSLPDARPQAQARASEGPYQANALLWAGSGGAASSPKPIRNARPGKADEGSFGGTVIDAATGKPFKGAKVVVRRYEAGKYQRQTTHTSDAQGRFTFNVSAEEMARKGLRLAVSVEAARYIGFSADLAADQSLAELRTGKGMGLRPHFDRMELFPMGQVSGTVVTPDGKPAVGAQVIACSVPQAGKFYHRLKIKGQTDKEGKFRIDVATPGAAFLYLVPESYAARYLDLKLKRGDLGTFTLEPGISLAGRVRDAKGKPLAGQWVRIETPMKRDLNPNFVNVGKGFGRWVKTGANGEFKAAPLPPGEYAVTIAGHGVQAIPGTTRGKDPLTDADVPAKPVEGLFMPKKVTLTKGEKPEEFELRPVPHVILTMRASDSKGRPKAGLYVQISGMLDGIGYSTVAGTGSDGISRIKVPHGLGGPGVLNDPRSAGLFIRTGWYSVRMKQGGPLVPGKRFVFGIPMGTFDSDRSLEVVVYDSPKVIVRVKTEDGGPLKSPMVSTEGVVGREAVRVREDQFWLEGVPVDEPFTVSASADGYQRVEQKCAKLPEGARKEIVITLRKKKR